MKIKYKLDIEDIINYRQSDAYTFQTLEERTEVLKMMLEPKFEDGEENRSEDIITTLIEILIRDSFYIYMEENGIPDTLYVFDDNVLTFGRRSEIDDDELERMVSNVQ